MVTTLPAQVSVKFFNRCQLFIISERLIFFSLSCIVSECGSPCVILQLNLTGHCHGLTVEETKDLWVQADIDGNGVVDYKEFKVISLKTVLHSSYLVEAFGA